MDAKEMRELANNAGRLEHERKAYAYFTEKIKKAAMEGRTRIFFSFTGGYEDPETGKWVSREESHLTREDAKSYYKSVGYKFEHVGVIGGVMQASDQEYIVW